MPHFSVLNTFKGNFDDDDKSLNEHDDVIVFILLLDFSLFLIFELKKITIKKFKINLDFGSYLNKT